MSEPVSIKVEPGETITIPHDPRYDNLEIVPAPTLKDKLKVIGGWSLIAIGMLPRVLRVIAPLFHDPIVPPLLIGGADIIEIFTGPMDVDPAAGEATLIGGGGMLLRSASARARVFKKADKQ